jgi:glycosyltransferase involved in cell wall biosynthesis
MARRRRIMLIGPGFRFLSGLSVYTCSLANALADAHDVSVVLLDRLIPARLYPGGHRVGQALTSMDYDPRVRRAGTIDWYWGPSARRITRELMADPPDVIVLQWWTAATLHTYLMVARAAAKAGIPVVLEFHEVQDTGEASVPFVAAYCRRFLHRLLRRASGAIFHNQHDADAFTELFGREAVGRLTTAIAPHGPFDHVTKSQAPSTPAEIVATDSTRPTRILSFGLIRPYKGIEDLIHTFDAMTPEQAAQFEIDVVGETWESWTTPADAIAASRYRDRIRFENRYVTDSEAAEYFAAADVLVLPYRRGSASGPLQIAMNNGIFVVLYAVGGLVEAVKDYPGAILIEPGDVDGLRRALLSIVDRRSERFADPHSWSPLVHAVESMIEPSR